MRIPGVDKYFETYELWRYTETFDSYGTPVKTPSKVKDIKGRLRQLRGDERFISDKVTSITTHRFYTRELTITPLDEIRKDGQAYEVVAVNNVMTFDDFVQLDLEVIQ